MLIEKYSQILPPDSKECLIQIGAHEGHEAPILKSAGFKQIVWIEADPDTFSKLKENIARFNGAQHAQHSVHNCLITASSGGQHRFYRYSNKGASSSIYQPTDLFQQTFEGVAITDDFVDLTSISLDDFAKEHQLTPSVLIVDVQGAELEVLRGASEVLKGVNVVEVEISQQSIYSGGALFPEVDRLLREADFLRVTRIPWHGDVIYIKRPSFSKLQIFSFRLLSMLRSMDDFLKFLPRASSLFVSDPVGAFRKAISRIR